MALLELLTALSVGAGASSAHTAGVVRPDSCSIKEPAARNLRGFLMGSQASAAIRVDEAPERLVTRPPLWKQRTMWTERSRETIRDNMIRARSVIKRGNVVEKYLMTKKIKNYDSALNLQIPNLVWNSLFLVLTVIYS